jgi:tetratricopeptide (TPR) repeat protein
MSAVDSLLDRGALHHARGHIAAAIELYREALALQPADIETRSNLAHALLEIGEELSALETLRGAPPPVQTHPQLQATEAALYCALGRHETALHILLPLTASGRTDEMAWINLALVQRELGADGPALASLREAHDINPDNARAAADLVAQLVSLGRADEACVIADDFLGRHPFDRQVLATYALALREAGRDDEAREISDPLAMPEIIDHDADDLPLGLLTEVAAHFADHPLAIRNPISKATRGGSQTGELDPASHPALAALTNWITAQLPIECRGLRWWATVLEAGGEQLPHIHPQSDWSGVFYVTLPALMQADEATAGALEIGRPPRHIRLRREPITQIVAPSPGRLVLFPSHLWHRTLTFTAAGSRVSLAFDALAASSDE